jgi:dihydrofolate reductase
MTTATLLERDLVDEFTVWTFPVLLGSGKRLFGVAPPREIWWIDAAYAR